MNGLPYYKAYPRDFIEGTVGMKFELKGAYRLVLDAIYMQGGELPDDARYISGLLGCSVRAWNSYRSKLLDLGKIYSENGIISNFRADKELVILRTLRDKNSENRSRPNKINNLQSRPFNHTEPEPDTEDNDDKSSSSKSAQSADAGYEVDIEKLSKHRRIEHRLRDAANLQNAPSPSLLNLSAIYGLLDAGACFETDILPTVQSVASRMKRPAGSWDYFTGPIQEAMKKRISLGHGVTHSETPLEQIDLDTWRLRLKSARRHKSWPIDWGAKPFEVGCLIPEELFTESDRADLRDIPIHDVREVA